LARRICAVSKVFAKRCVQNLKCVGKSCGSRILEGWRPPYDATVVERLRAAVENLRREDLPPITISVGVASLSGRTRLRPEGLFDEADGALYAAKTAGRNRVVVVADPMPDGSESG
jgi:GGDEF domain-containing protein